MTSVRGPGGGYNLAKAKAAISVSAIISAVDENIDATQCGGKENCHGTDGRCMTHELWATLNTKILDYLSDVSLADMVSAQQGKDSGTVVFSARKSCETNKAVVNG